MSEFGTQQRHTLYYNVADIRRICLIVHTVYYGIVKDHL